MTRFWRSALLMMTLCCAAPAAQAVFIVRVGNTVYVDGKEYSWEDWKKIRDTYESASPATALPGDAPLAATCVTAIYYDEFPSEDERFQCTSGLGALTREEVLRRGWKVDLIEKIPPPAGSPAESVRGRPLSLYKLVISRSGTPVAQPTAKPQPAGTARRAQRPLDSQCFQDCLGTGGNRAFCDDRCTY
jgi:hypothetical protein